MKKIKGLIVILFLTTIILEGVYVFYSNRVSETSFDVSRLTYEIDEIEERNTSLKTELLKYSSFNNISSRAAELGLVEGSDSSIAIKSPIDMALAR